MAANGERRAHEVWKGLAGAWRESLSLAWEAYCAGSVPVGALVIDADGRVLARGRNRIFEAQAPRGQIAGSRVAHAEINALVQLGWDKRYHDHTLYSTLEPCSQCIGAAWFSTIGAVEYAAADVYGGAARLIEVQSEVANIERRYPMRVHGPLDAPFGTLAEVLPAEFFLRCLPDHDVSGAYKRRRPTIAALAERLSDLRRLAVSETPLEEVLERVWDRVCAVAAPRSG